MNLLPPATALIFASIALSGCGSVAPVVALDSDTFMVGSHGVLGNGSAAAERAKAVQAAQEFCAAKSERAEVLKIDSVDPFFGRAPSADVRFKCVRM
jgi:hypothetical protein